jgi:hypothetical protein
MNEIKTIVFDWGDTLMKEFPGAVGPMVFWPEVAEVSGAGKALHKLDGSYNLILASNARESTAVQIKQALGRVGLDRYINKIFTFQELGFRKPDRGFFRQIGKITGDEPENLVMVGDHYFNDIMGGYHAGWRTIWLNEKFQLAPGLAALHTVEIYQMNELPGAIKWLDLPDWQQCQKWYMETSPSMRLWLHVQLVASTSYILALWMRRNGCMVNPILAHRGGLLHDICKLKPDKQESHHDHGELGGEWLREKGQPELAEISYRHILDAILDEKRKPKTLEEKVVYYADKLCEESKVVDLDMRLTALIDRYPGHTDRIKASIPALMDLQKELAMAVGEDENTLIDHIKRAISRQ